MSFSSEAGREVTPTVAVQAHKTRINLAWFFYQRKTTCPFRESYPDVLMMQPIQDRNADNGARSLDCSMQGRIFL
jgi:hypothetical protein